MLKRQSLEMAKLQVRGKKDIFSLTMPQMSFAHGLMSVA